MRHREALFNLPAEIAALETTTKKTNLSDIDLDGFADAIFATRKQFEGQITLDDAAHLKKMIWVNRIFTILGYATAWILPNPISAYFIAQGIFGRWVTMHHVGHGGYDKVPGLPKQFHSERFAQGWRRYIDWFDWILPEAWNYEHNILHHYYTSEQSDPDLVEDHAAFLRALKIPTWMKYPVVAFISVTWKFTYYAPNTLRAMEEKGRNEPITNVFSLVWENAIDLRRARVRKLWFGCYLPYMIVAFVIIPLLFTPLGWWAVMSVLINRILAEFITNFHSFLVVAPNHSGEDLYRFDRHFEGRREYCLFQVISSCNYKLGSDSVDYIHGWLNYQIEHHLAPKLPMLKYRQMQPQIYDICRTFDVPYVQEGVWTRLWRMVQIMVGNRSMIWLDGSELARKDEVAEAETAPAMSTFEDSRDGTLALEH